MCVSHIQFGKRCPHVQCSNIDVSYTMNGKVSKVLLLIAIAQIAKPEHQFNSAFNNFGAFGITNLPDFVGFSYSRADTKNAPSTRFISFMHQVTLKIIA